jgi:hypothetical protein
VKKIFRVENPKDVIHNLSSTKLAYNGTNINNKKTGGVHSVQVYCNTVRNLVED